MSRLTAWLLPAVLLGNSATSLPLYEVDSHPLAVVSELGQRLASHSRLQEADIHSSLPLLFEPGDSRIGLSKLEAGDSRLGLPARLEPGESRLGLPSLPTPQEIDTIKKVAQILVMLGEQVIPTIIGDNILPAPAPAPIGHASCDPAVPVQDVPNDPVNLD